MKRNKNGKKTERCLRYSPFFSDILHFSPKMTAKTTENDCENESSGNRSRNSFLGNSVIFRANSPESQ